MATNPSRRKHVIGVVNSLVKMVRNFLKSTISEVTFFGDFELYVNTNLGSKNSLITFIKSRRNKWKYVKI